MASNRARLLWPSRVYKAPNYNNAIYSDDGGRTLLLSGTFSIIGTREGAPFEVAERPRILLIPASAV